MSLRSALTLTLGLSLHRLSPTTARAASTCAHDAVPGALLVGVAYRALPDRGGRCARERTAAAAVKDLLLWAWLEAQGTAALFSQAQALVPPELTPPVGCRPAAHRTSSRAAQWDVVSGSRARVKTLGCG